MNQIVRITDVCDFQGGTQPPKNLWIKEFEDGYVRMLQIRDFTQPDKDNVEYVPIKKTLKTCEENDILIGRYGASVGKICTGLSGAYNVALIKTIPNEKKISRDYLLHLLKGYTFQNFILNVGGRAAQAGFNKEDLEGFSFSLPPLPSQKKIAAILDAADTYRQLTKALIAKYDELTQSLFLDMFGDPVSNPKGWKEYKLETLCGVGSSKRVFVDELVEAGIPFYRGTEVGQLGEELAVSPTLFITEKHYKELVAHTGKPEVGDLLMPSICPDGRIYRVADDKPFYFKDGRVLWIKVDKSKIGSLFLRYFLKEIFYANYYNIASGTTFAELKIVALKKLKIQLPPLDLQNQFEANILHIKAQKSQAQASLDKAEDLFNSLLQRAFKGELN